MNYIDMVPLIGGMSLAQGNVLGKRPKQILSYTPFTANDSHLLNYYNNEQEYVLLDKEVKKSPKVEIVTALCPCAGLSQMHHSYGDHNPNNKWMIETAKYVLSELKPEVFWGENAPGLAGKIGKTVRENLANIAKENKYSFSLYRTKSLFHGTPQVRERSFYFFWKSGKIPVFPDIKREYIKIEDLIDSVKTNLQHYAINEKIPSRSDPYYRYILSEIHPGFTHAEFSSYMSPLKVRTNDVNSYIEKSGHDYMKVSVWMKDNGYDNEAEKCIRKYEKLKSGGNIMRRGTIIPKDHIGAFVGHYPLQLTHPVLDRYITYREAMTIMGLPSDFVLLNEKKSVNHICQNVPLTTATDMANHVVNTLEGKLNTVDIAYALQYNNGQMVQTKNTSTLEQFMEI